MNRPMPTLVNSAALPYMLSVPTTEDTAEPWPILCFLHGYDEGPPTPAEQALTRHGPLRPSSSTAATSEFIVVAPQLPSRGDLWHKYADQVRDIVQQVRREYHGDSQRTFLTGFSFGGNGVLDLALAQPDLWQALWPVDPTRVAKLQSAQQPKQPIWFSSGQISRYAEDAFIQRLQLQRLDAGQTEKIIPGDRVYIDQSADHVGTATLAYQDDRIYRWLLAL